MLKIDMLEQLSAQEKAKLYALGKNNSKASMAYKEALKLVRNRFKESDANTVVKSEPIDNSLVHWIEGKK